MGIKISILFSLLLPSLAFSLVVDINSASLDEIWKLPISQEDAYAIYEYRERHGYFESVYAIRKIPEIDGEEFELIKPLIKIIVPKKKREIFISIAKLQDRLAAEERPSYGAIDEWEDLLIHPMNINKAGIDEILLLDRVSLVDAASVLRYRKERGDIKNRRTLRKVKGLSYYGYRNMRNFITFEDEEEKFRIRTFLRMRYDYNSRLDVGENNVYDLLEDMRSAVDDLNDPEFYYNLSNSGWSADGLYKLKKRIESEIRTLEDCKPTGNFYVKGRVLGSDKVKAGFIAEKSEDESSFNITKGYFGLYNLKMLDRLFLGDYRVTLGQGILMDNTDEFLPRTQRRTCGIFGDITGSKDFTFRGGGLRLRLGRFKPLFFYSEKDRDAILNPDGTVNHHFPHSPNCACFEDKLKEKTVGSSLDFDLSDLFGAPMGTSIAFNGYQSLYSKEIRPAISTLDIPNDKDSLGDPNFTASFTGKKRVVYGVSGRTVVNNLSAEGEYGRLKNGGSAYTGRLRVQYETLYLLFLYRHYDVDYDNPYSRGFSERNRYEDTVLEKPYRLIDPFYTQLQDYPVPRAEDGLYMETRWQITRRITITRAYIDLWKDLAYGLPCYRFQGEIEFRPVFPVRLRFKQKWQRKGNPKRINPTYSLTDESTFRTFVYLTEWDRIGFDARYGKVKFSPGYTENIMIKGGYLSFDWLHNFSSYLSLQGGIVAWDTEGMSQWIFEDRGIDFLEGDGVKYYITIIDRISPNLSLRLKYKSKASYYPHTGLYEDEYHFGDGRRAGDFEDIESLANFDIQLDIRW